jgi:hypothetical protein
MTISTFARRGERAPEALAGLAQTMVTGSSAAMAFAGDPLRDIGILADHERNLPLIMKDGSIFKNELN